MNTLTRILVWGRRLKGEASNLEYQIKVPKENLMSVSRTWQILNVKLSVKRKNAA